MHFTAKINHDYWLIVSLSQCPGKFTDISSILVKEEHSKDLILANKEQSPDHDYAKPDEDKDHDTIIKPFIQHLKASSSLRRSLSFDGIDHSEKASELNLSGDTFDFATVSCQVFAYYVWILWF